MSSRTEKKMIRVGAGKPSIAVRGLVVVATLLTTAAVGVVSTSLLAPSLRAPGGQAGLCPNLEIDQNTGNIRDKGLIPCDRLTVQNGRLDLIRDGFKGR